MEMIVQGGGRPAAPAPAPGSAPGPAADPTAERAGREAAATRDAGELETFARGLELLARAAAAPEAPGVVATATRWAEKAFAPEDPTGPGLLGWLDGLRREAAARQGLGAYGRALDAVADVPLPPALRRMAGDAVTRRAQRAGLLPDAPWVQGLARSHLTLKTAAAALGSAREPGEAPALLAGLEADPDLVPDDRAFLAREVRRRDAVAVARHSGRLAEKEAADRAAFARGEAVQPMTEAGFAQLHGPAAAERWQDYRRAQEQGRATATILGRDAAGIEVARGHWDGAPEVFEAAVAADAARRVADPVAYLIAARPEVGQAYAETEDPVARQWQLCQAQQEAGLASEGCLLWTAAERATLADDWDALPPGHAGRNERLAFFREHVLAYPPALRPHAIHTLVRDGIVEGSEAEVAALVAELEAGRNNRARQIAVGLTPMPGGGPAAAAAAASPETVRPLVEPAAAGVSVPGHQDLLVEEDGPEVTAVTRPDPDDPLSLYRAQVEIFQRVARVSSKRDLEQILPLIEEIFGRSETGVRLVAIAHDMASPHRAIGRDPRTGWAFDFPTWASDLGYYRTRDVVAAGGRVEAAGFEVASIVEGQLLVRPAGENDTAISLSASHIAAVSFSIDHAEEKFRLALEALAGKRPLDELLAEAEAIDPPVTRRNVHAKRGILSSKEVSDTAENLLLARTAIERGADHSAVTAALLMSLLPPSDIESLVTLMIELSPVGLVLDVIDSVEAIKTLRESSESDERSGAWWQLATLAVQALPIGKIGRQLKRGSRATGKEALTRLADFERLKRDELRELGERFKVASDKRGEAHQISKTIGDQSWNGFSDMLKAQIRGVASNIFGGVAEDIGRLAAEATLRSQGKSVVGRNVNLVYSGQNFNIDVVGLKPGAKAVPSSGPDTIQIRGEHYNLLDVELIDVKFGSSTLTGPQRKAQEAMGGRLKIVQYKPKLEDLPIDDLIDRLNNAPQIRALRPPVVFTPEMFGRLTKAAAKDTTFESYLFVLLLSALAMQPAASLSGKQESEG